MTGGLLPACTSSHTPCLPPAGKQMLEVNEQQHQRLSSKEAEAQREVNAALGALPRTFNRLQRIFGAQVRCAAVGALPGEVTAIHALLAGLQHRLSVIWLPSSGG